MQVPKMKFGGVEISRLICGYNIFHGQSHTSGTLNALMTEYYTHERVVEDLHRCNRYGINCCSVTPSGRSVLDQEAFQIEGGKMHIIFQGDGDPTHPSYNALKPLAIYHHGEQTDPLFRSGKMDQVREWCKKTRDKGVQVGVGTHNPEVLALVEEQGWDIDFYAGCVYYRNRTEEEKRKLLGGELPMGELFLTEDPPRMYKYMKQTRKVCFAFKILAAGRATNIEAAFRQAFDNLKPTDGVIVGMFTRMKDQIAENAGIMHKILTPGV